MIAIVDYNAGNVRSVLNALHRLGAEAEVTSDPNLLKQADRVIFPGVGNAKPAMQKLREKGLDKILLELTQPFLGICLGMQLMCSHSEEGDTDCLGIFPEKVKRFEADKRVPHMGWNELTEMKASLFEGLPDRADVYFVHSYFVELGSDTSAKSEYGHPFTAALQRDNFYGVQFHPEKSGETGAKILSNFLKINP
ncbi:MAG: glutamine amidotransferase [Cryomorphaceae bacterium]|jgi:glutamine amidotransferase